MWKTIRGVVPERWRRALRVAINLARRKPHLLGRVIGTVKLGSLVDVLGYFETFDALNGQCVQVGLRGSGRVVYLRPGSTDFVVFRQVVLERQYDLPVARSAEYIIDAGANVGLTSLMFLEKYPRARVLSLEPDPENYEIARMNLRGFEERSILLNAAVWNEDCELAIRRGEFCDGREWATQVVPACRDDELTVPARSLESLLKEYSFPWIDLLKIDIEGSELTVFRDGDTAFLQRTGCCAIECHGAECLAAFSASAVAEKFDLSQSGELTVAVRSKYAEGWLRCVPTP